VDAAEGEYQLSEYFLSFSLFHLLFLKECSIKLDSVKS
jgi:hypothetical protein